ncbi:MAG: peptidase [Firmicutes bacterium HGW-Firmicutes-2]|nr:MAG: peptidase [Firmicutes bacterium HGW-Firmicutes-2]
MNVINSAEGDDLEVEINSGGGSVFAGSEIYTALKSYTGNVTVKIMGIAASAASVIAMAGKKIIMSPTSQMMVHNVSTIASGDHRDMNHMSDVLKGANETIANAYRIKSGKTQEELLELMDNETWLTPAKAVEMGLADEIMFEELNLVADIGGMLPQAVIEKVKNLITEDKALENRAFFDAKIKLLKLKGDQRDE